jgi:hypothetical protein
MRKNRRSRTTLFFERMEDRVLLTAANVFAQFDGAVLGPADTQQVNIALLPADFTFQSSRAVLGFLLTGGPGSALDPAAITITAAGGAAVNPTFSQTDLNGAHQSLVVAPLRTGPYTLGVTGLGGTAGPFHLDVFLPGDVNGDRHVTLSDGQTIQSIYGLTSASPNYKVEADANLDGTINAFDYAQWRLNYTVSTDINPLSLTASPPPGLPHLLSGGLVTNQVQVQVTGTTLPGTTVHLETGADGNFDDGTFTADGSGNYAAPVALSEGLNTLQFQVQDGFGQQRNATVAITLDTQPPVVPVFDLSSTSIADASAAHQTSAARVTLVGQTDPNVTVTLVETGATTLSTNTGAFQFPNVMLALGGNPFTVQATDAAGNASSSTQTITRVAASGQPNAVIAWNQAALSAIQLDASDPPHASRALALVQAAVYDAVNAIDGTPGYYARIAAPAGASAEAAVDQAAYTVLSYLYPAQQANFAALLASRLAQVPNGQPKTDGLSVGQAAANALIALRAHDGYDTFVDFTPQLGPGQWQPTPPAYAEALDPQWATLTPFAMTSPSQFRPAGPPDLTSQQWADAANEVKSLGSATSTTRTADQTQIARFWADGSGTVTPAGHWNAIAEQIAQQQGDSLAADARLFAELNVALGDAAIVAWDAKFTYTSWRPITAIRNADQAGNSAVQADPSWTPLLVTPNFPEYVSGHSTYSAAAATVLDALFGSNIGFSSTSAGFTRSFTSFDQAAAEAGQSRIYGGIHFQFANQDGQAAGRALGTFVLQSFAVSSDTQPPRVTLTAPPSSTVSATNLTILGQVVDNLSGVQKLELQTDGGSYVPLTFDAAGNFGLATTFALNGSADGTHVFLFRATDFAGNVSTPLELDFTLDTQAPALGVTAPAPNATLTAGAHLTGTASGTGSALVSLSFAIDNGPTMPLAFDSASGAFDQGLNLTGLTTGGHTLTLTARDAAGNASVTTIAVTLPAAPPVAVTDSAPADGATDIGATYRPKITFSAPIDVSTLSANDFYATDTTGTRLAATIVPSSDHTYAWLFLTNPMPGASTITVTVDGSMIHSANGAPIDAARTGTAGSVLTFSFSTVSESFVPGTTITGIVADPGPDLKPETVDDVKAGPDGVLMTGDDVYLLPIANVKVYILGHEDQAVYTDAQGRFTLTSVPVGDVKLGIDGRTATNAPAGYYFPEMVMDLTIQPGIANTVMGSMGTDQQQAATAAVQGVYLPRLQSSILQSVSNTQMTEVGVSPQAAPDLTPQQASELKIDIAPGSLIGMNGQAMTSGQVGISTVPPQLVMDMLPPGLMQHTFDITIQAPGVATFATPAAMTFPNVFHAAPGTKLNFLSFDHTTGRLVIDGTATVSADGLTVTTDPGKGITHPGWHGLTPPGTDGDDPESPGPDPNDPCDDPRYDRLLDENYSDAVQQRLAELQAADDKRLQPLGTRGLGPLTIGLPYANEDNYQVTIPADRLPDSFDPASFLKSWPQNMNAVPLAGSAENKTFQYINRFDTPTGTVHPGDVIGIHIRDPKTGLPYPDTAYVMMTDQQTNYYRFSTLTDIKVDIFGTQIGIVHPVSGSREFGYTQNDDGSITFYTRGLDSPTNWFAELGGVPAQRAGWSNFVEGIAERFGYTPDQAKQLLRAEDHEVKDEPPCHTPPGGEDPPDLNPPIVPAPAPKEPLQLYWRAVLLSGGNSLGETDFTGRVSSGQDIRVFLPPRTDYSLYVYDPNTNKWGRSAGVTAAQGASTLTPVYINLDPGPVQADGLAEAATFIIGTNPDVVSTAGDGISDGAKVALGLNPLGKFAFPIGVIASLPLQGQAKEVVAQGSTGDPKGQTAYVATGSYGLAVVNASEFNKPLLLGQLQLPGSSGDVAFDALHNLAVVAAGSGGLHLVDVSNATMPKLQKTVALSGGANRVEVSDGLAYVASGSSVVRIDPATGQVVQTLALGGGTVTDLAHEGTMLYSMDANKILRAIDISGSSMVVRGSLTLANGGGKLFVGNGIAYVPASDLNSGGFSTVNVSDPTHLTLIAGPIQPGTGKPGTAIVANGSGLGLLAGSLNFVFGGFKAVDLVSLTDPTNTYNFLTRFNLPDAPNGLAIASGIAYIADNTGGLQVVNYVPFDNKGIPPTLSISTSAADADLLTPGLQVFEGTTLPVKVNATDDVQVRNVELLVNGQVVRNNVSFPFDFSAIAPTIAASGSTFTIQVRATDTGGNVGLSNVLTIGLVNDTSPLTISNFSPANSSSQLEGVQAVRVTFSKAVASATVTTANFQLKDGAGNPLTPLSLDLRGNDTLVQLTFSPLLAGTYQLVINGAAVTDRVGHALSTGNVTDSFTLTPRETLTVSNADADPGTPGLQLYEGTTVHGSVTVDSSVSVQKVEVLSNSQVIASSTAAPLSFSFIAPLLSTGATTFTLQARVTDTTGAATVSSLLSVGLLRDTTPPTIAGVNPASGGTAFGGLTTVTVTFSKPLATASVSAANFHLFKAGTSGVFDGTETAVAITGFALVNDDTQTQLTVAPLTAGTYELLVTKNGITDRPGNALGTGTFTSQFTVAPFSSVLLLGAEFASDEPAVRSALASTGALGGATIRYVDTASSTPSLATLQQYSAVLAWTDYPPQNATALGNVLAQYVDGGGALVISTYSTSSSWAIAGNIQTTGYDPFQVEPPGFGWAGSGTTYHSLTSYTPSNSLFAGITGTPTYWTNANYVNAPLSTGASLLGTDSFGNRVIAVNSKNNVVGITIYPGFLGSQTTDQQVYRLFANALLYAANRGGGQPQFFAGQPKTPADGLADLTQEELQPVVVQAIAQLAGGGYKVNGLDRVEFHLARLPDSLLGWTSQTTIWIDPNAQGYGWFTDVSPGSNGAFTLRSGANEVQAEPGSPAYGHVDLLTVVTHELGHVLGFASIDASALDHDWMTATLGIGVRRYRDAAAGSGLPPAPQVPLWSAVPASPAGRAGDLGSPLPGTVASPVPSSGLALHEVLAPTIANLGSPAAVVALAWPDGNPAAIVVDRDGRSLVTDPLPAQLRPDLGEASAVDWLFWGRGMPGVLLAGNGDDPQIGDIPRDVLAGDSGTYPGAEAVEVPWGDRATLLGLAEAKPDARSARDLLFASLGDASGSPVAAFREDELLSMAICEA